MDIVIETLRALQDNYVYLVGRRHSNERLVIDPSEAAPVTQALKAKGLRLGLILNTHHHHDHIGGNLELKREWNAPIYCSDVDLERIPGVDRGLADGETFHFDGIEIETIGIPGHTQGQTAYYIEAANTVFVGDTVFSMGCGRLFEGTPEQMLGSLRRLAKLPPQTRLGIGHEYTERNAAFAHHVESDNAKVMDRLARTRSELSTRGVASLPELREELETNPFFRPNSPSIRSFLGMPLASDIEVFARLREMRNTF